MPGRDTRGTTLPSGQQVEIEAGGYRAVIVEVGGGIRTFSRAGRELLDGYPANEMATSGRGQVLMPWPNRVRDGRYTFDGREHQLSLDEVELGNAIHGLVRWVAWTVRERAPGRVVMEHHLRPRPGYPFALDLSIDYSLSEDGLAVATEAINVGASSCPFGGGAHPWLTVGTPTIDPATLRIPAAVAMWSDERSIPVRSGPVDGTDLDFRAGRPIGATEIDNGWTKIERDADGIAHVGLEGPAGDAIDVWFDQGYPYVMVCTGDVLPDVARRSIAIEPMTCPPNAFQTGEALIRLEPGDAFAGRWGIRAG
jgi:aldose 1-epimerase